MVVDDPNLELVNDDHLLRLNVRPKFFKYLRQLWGRRYFIAAEANGKSFDSQRDMFLGRAWVILSPLLDAALYGVLFGLLLRTSRGIENFIGYLIIGIIFFGYMQMGLIGGTTLIKSSQNMIAAFTFPRAALVFSQTVRNFIAGLAPALVAIVGALAFQWGNPPTWRIFLIIPLYILIHVFATGTMFIVARLCAFVPDLRTLVRVAGRAWFFTSGVFFSIERYATVPIIQEIMVANPAYQFLQAVRGVVMYADVPGLQTWVYLTAWAFGTFGVGLIFFWRAEERYGTLH
ncbi:ABC transporter permease [Corynebacterium halotolerans YIM 70093 = DSM 44683]|uniref:Transport permease protein n=1 Tax=Corynebacterium halotolerans YIM 70093 = DSM 44683 TaxID=1121362 RepID=M1NZX3_9CORY|nr:ABC transporter permease [Corynebacterium halotolerans YIM 70093 = DSM 44683]